MNKLLDGGVRYLDVVDMSAESYLSVTQVESRALAWPERLKWIDLQSHGTTDSWICYMCSIERDMITGTLHRWLKLVPMSRHSF